MPLQTSYPYESQKLTAGLFTYNTQRTGDIRTVSAAVNIPFGLGLIKAPTQPTDIYNAGRVRVALPTAVAGSPLHCISGYQATSDAGEQTYLTTITSSATAKHLANTPFPGLRSNGYVTVKLVDGTPIPVSGGTVYWVQSGADAGKFRANADATAAALTAAEAVFEGSYDAVEHVAVIKVKQLT